MDLALAPRTAARRVRVRPRSLKIPITLACLLAGGCSKFHEVHYLKSNVSKGQTPNYFRVTVNGDTFMSSSRFMSGYFDEAAVNTYFGGFKQPEGGRLTAVASETKESGVMPIAATESGSTLILLLTSNADEIANSLNALANSEAITQALAGIVSHDQLEAAAQNAADAPAQESAGAALATMGSKLIPAEPAAGVTLSPPAVRADLLAYANKLASSLEPGTHFDSLEQAKLWVRTFKLSATSNGGSR